MYGKCRFCKHDPACSNEKHLLEGIFSLKIPGKIKEKSSPWQRIYHKNKTAPWEKNPYFCYLVQFSKLKGSVLLDAIDAAIFDFLIQNGDRHDVRKKKFI